MRLYGKIRHILPCLLAGALLQAAWADQIVLKNGDRVTGSIVKKDGKNLTVKTDNFGIVVMPWDQVESIIAEKPVHMVLRDGKTVQGTAKSRIGNQE